MQFARALKFYIGDGRWFRKLLTLAAIQLIPLAGLAAVTGWALEICRGVIRNQKDEVPGINLRRQIPDGFSVWAIGLAYLLPAAALAGLGGYPFRVDIPGGSEQRSRGIQFLLVGNSNLLRPLCCWAPRWGRPPPSAASPKPVPSGRRSNSGKLCPQSGPIRSIFSRSS